MLSPYTYSTRLILFRLLAVMLVVVALFHWVDRGLTQLLYANGSEWVSEVFDVIDELGSAEFYLVPALLLYIWAMVALRRGWTPPARWQLDRVARGSLYLMLTMALGGVLTALLKAVVARARPELLLEQGIYGLGVPFTSLEEFDSFPSSHTQAAFAAAAALAVLAPRWRWPLMMIATAVGLARLINLDHYLSDVIAAATLAITSAAVLAPLVLSPAKTWPVRTPWRWWSRGP